MRLRRTPHPRPASTTVGLLGPDAIEVGARTIRVDDTLCQTVAVTGYPREITPGWLEPLLTFPAPIDVTLHVEPVPPQTAADRLRKQRARLESSLGADTDHGRLQDPEVAAAAEDAADLAHRLARGEGRLFRVGIYVTVRGRTETDLEATVGRVRALLSSLLLTAHPATYRTLQGWLTTQPLALDALRLRRTFDTQALAATFPFSSGDLPTADGVLYGRTTGSQGLVFWDRFSQTNYNSVILADSGAGKSYLAKLELLRSLYRGVQVAVIDPEDEYRRLADAVGGTTLRLGAPGVALNPFDLQAGDGAEAVTRRALFIHTLVDVLLGQPLDPAGTAALDRAVIAVYARAGITSDPRTHRRPAPLLRDLAEVLGEDADPAAQTLAARLAPYVSGTHRRLFDGPTSHTGDTHLLVLSLKELPDELTPAATLLTLDAIWRRVTDPAHRTRRLVVVDEAWTLMQHGAGARFLYRLAKSARKHWAGLTTITQDAHDLLGSELGQAVVHNAATAILLHQSPHGIDQVGRAFKLSDGERAYLVAARQGEGLLSQGAQLRIAFRAEASPAEDELITTDPHDLNDQAPVVTPASRTPAARSRPRSRRGSR